MTDNQLKNIDPEDIEDLLVEVEKSFGIKFVGNELVHITTFGELFSYITGKIKLDNVDNCTSQQAFYKLCEAISTTLQLENKTITTDYPLCYILPRQSRRSTTKRIENHLGFKLKILRTPHWINTVLIITFLISLVGIFFNWRFGLSGFVIYIVSLQFSKKMGNELDLETVGQIAEKMARENYLKSRRNQQTFNKKEIEKVLTDWFSVYLDLPKSKLTRESQF
jgi:hypothetical protein